MYLSQFEKVFQVKMSFITHVSVQTSQSEHFDCAKEFAFRKLDPTMMGPLDKINPFAIHHLVWP